MSCEKCIECGVIFEQDNGTVCPVCKIIDTASKPESADIYTKVADKYGLKREDVKSASFSLMYSPMSKQCETLEETVEQACRMVGLIG